MTRKVWKFEFEIDTDIVSDLEECGEHATSQIKSSVEEMLELYFSTEQGHAVEDFKLKLIKTEIYGE